MSNVLYTVYWVVCVLLRRYIKNTKKNGPECACAATRINMQAMLNATGKQAAITRSDSSPMFVGVTTVRFGY